MACSTCGESRFANEAQALCHGYRNHAEFTCGCEKKFFTEKALEEHKKDQEKSQKEKKCEKCCRSFKKRDALNDHKKAKDHWLPDERDRVQAETGRSYCDCGKSFKTPQGLVSHKNDKPSLAKEHPCYTCTSKFKTSASLSQHQRDTNHTQTDVRTPKEARQLYLSNYHEVHARVSKDDMKESVAVVRDTMGKIMEHVRNQEDGKIYAPNMVKAGSTAVKTKIGKANEFDYNVPLNIRDVEVKDRGPLNYKFQNPNGVSSKHMKADVKLVDTPNSKKQIPNGYASASVPNGKVPSKLTKNGDIIPRYVQKDLHEKMEKAIKDLKLDRKGVSLSKDAHGPALTATIKQPGKHDINVDVTPSLPSNVPVTANCWPRPDTRKALTGSQIDRVISTGTHLVPKGDVVFAVSYSRAEKELLRTIDAGNGCRRQCHKVMKCYVQEYCSKSPDGAPGISTHILKHQLFNMNEKLPSSDHWHQRNLGERIPDMMRDTERVLRSGKLPSYFNTGENILAGKDRAVLKGLADYLRTEREKLLHIQ